MLPDSSSAGPWKSTRFWATFSCYHLAIEPEDSDVCLVLLSQSTEDSQALLYLSKLFLRRIKKMPVKTIMLDKVGYYPLEDFALQRMADAIIQFS